MNGVETVGKTTPIRPDICIHRENLFNNASIVLKDQQLWPMPNVMAALPNISGALGSTTQSLADAHY